MPVYAQTNSKLESRDSSLSPLTAQQWLMDGLPNQPMKWSNSARAGSSRLLNFARASTSKPHPIQRCCSISHLHLVHRRRRKECSCKSTAPLFFDHTDSWNACRFFLLFSHPCMTWRGFEPRGCHDDEQWVQLIALRNKSSTFKKEMTTIWEMGIL